MSPAQYHLWHAERLPRSAMYSLPEARHQRKKDHTRQLYWCVCVLL